VLIPFLVYGAVNNAVRLPLYGKSQVGKQYRYPEFLENGVLGIAPEIGEPDLFFEIRRFIRWMQRQARSRRYRQEMIV
ncbi:hypothetical protein AALD22_26170, partial [Lachnospiraceae bacterium 56-18]